MRTWTPLKSRHHAADRRNASVTAARHSRSSGSPHAATMMATGRPWAMAVAVTPDSELSSAVTESNPSTPSNGVAAA